MPRGASSARLWGSRFVADGSVPRGSALWASPFRSFPQARSSGIFCCVPSMRTASYSPCLSSPCGHRSGLQSKTSRLRLSVSLRFGPECLNSLAYLVPTLPFADFCAALVRAHAPLNPECRTRHRTPKVSATAFSAHLPDIPPQPFDDTALRSHCPLVRPGRPRIWFPSVRSQVCSGLPSDPASRRRPCPSLILHRHQVG